MLAQIIFYLDDAKTVLNTFDVDRGRRRALTCLKDGISSEATGALQPDEVFKTKAETERPERILQHIEHCSQLATEIQRYGKASKIAALWRLSIAS